MSSVSSNPLSASLHTGGIIAVSVVGFVSILAILALASSLAWKLVRKTDDNAIRLLLSQFGALYICLICSDAMQATAFILSLSRLQNQGPSNSVPPSCIAQGALLNAGDIGSACFNITIALHTLYVVVRKRKPARWAVALAIAVVGCMMLLFTIIGPYTLTNATDGPFFSDTGYWCWISKPYSAARLYLHYVWVFLAALVSICAYCGVAFILYTRPKFGLSREQEASKRLDALARRMLFFPVVYLVNVLPLAVARCLAMAGKTVPWPYLLFGGIVFALNGALNVLLFGFSHRFIKFKVPRRVSAISSDTLLKSGSLPPTPVTQLASGRSRRQGSLDFEQMLKEGAGVGDGETVTVLLSQGNVEKDVLGDEKTLVVLSDDLECGRNC